MFSLALLGAVLSATPESYVIVVGNNQSPVLGRPQLRYADDDAARTAEVFGGVLPATTVELLTEFDDDSARLFPREVAKAAAPTVKNVEAAFSRLSAWATARKAAGVRTRGYFIFAGHGDIDQGEGFIELKDGRLTSHDVERLLTSAAADELHVVLDSCNSWFVLSPRKAGGRHFPTPAEATAALVARMPNVGVLLSTSAEAEVYEWSELQSGVFSYALRSGLIGGADANGDGDVSYDELAAFIDSATRGIKNPSLRPRVFARGPGGGLSGGFASLTDGQSTVLTATAAKGLRLRFRDGIGVRWFDVHLAAGNSATLRLPGDIEGLVVQRGTDAGWSTFELPRGRARLDLNQVTVQVVEAQARGSAEALSGLFEEPFDATTVRTWRERDAAQAEKSALGISSDAVNRVRFFLKTASNRDRSQRLALLSIGGAGAVVGLGTTLGLLFAEPKSPQSGFSIAMAGAVSTEFLLLGLVGLFPSKWEQQAEAFERSVDSGDLAGAMLATDSFLETRQREYTQNKLMTRIGGGVLCAIGLGLALYRPAETPQVGFAAPFQLAGAATGAIGLGAIVSSFWMRSPEQDLYDALREERRGAPSVNLGVSLLPEGAAVSVQGHF